MAHDAESMTPLHYRPCQVAALLFTHHHEDVIICDSISMWSFADLVLRYSLTAGGDPWGT